MSSADHRAGASGAEGAVDGAAELGIRILRGVGLPCILFGTVLKIKNSTKCD